MRDRDIRAWGGVLGPPLAHPCTPTQTSMKASIESCALMCLAEWMRAAAWDRRNRERSMPVRGGVRVYACAPQPPPTLSTTSLCAPIQAGGGRAAAMTYTPQVPKEQPWWWRSERAAFCTSCGACAHSVPLE